MITVPSIPQFQLELRYGVDYAVRALNVCHMLAVGIFSVIRKKTRVMQNQQFLLNAAKIPHTFLQKM